MGYSSSSNKPLVLSMEKTRREQEILMSSQNSKITQQNESASKENVVTLGKMIKFVKDGDKVTKFFFSFEYDGNVFELGDFVLVRHAVEGKKPFVGIVKAIASDKSNEIMVTTQCFYRPEEVKNREDKYYKTHDKRELFYSFHCKNILPESIHHKCVVHFIPSHKQLPLRTLHPGFIVQKVYDIVEKKLRDLTDRGFDEEKQHEIDLLCKKTQKRIGNLPDIAVKTPRVNEMHSFTRKRTDPFIVEPTTAIDELSNAYSGCARNVSKYHTILAKYRVLTGNAVRDKRLEMLLQGLQKLCSATDYKSKNNISADDMKTCWPDAVIPIIAKLERETYETLGNDIKKYSQKIRQLDYNLQKSESLVRRLLKKDLEPIALLTMTPDELKEGLTADERMILEPETTERMQMTDICCTRCSEKCVGIKDVINTGGFGDRYQLECCGCGHAWFSSRDAIALSSVPD